MDLNSNNFDMEKWGRGHVIRAVVKIWQLKIWDLNPNKLLYRLHIKV